MKFSDTFKSSLDSLDHKWHECDLYLNIVCTDLETLKKNELDYDTIKKLFSFLDQKSRHFSQIEFLKEKYSEFFEKYQQEKREEEKRFEEVLQKVMDDESKTMKEKYGYGTDADPYTITPDFTDAFVVDQADGGLFGWVTSGVTVMPSFEKLLSVDERWLVVNYIRKCLIERSTNCP